jgi:hypothetical protein
METIKLDTTLVGVAGEYLVAGELSLRGYTAGITLRNSRGVDIVVSLPDGSKSFSIQVKTSSGKTKKWMLNKKAEETAAPNHFYVFVQLSRDPLQRPCFHVVPSKVVARHTRDTHAAWLKGTKSDGTQRKDSAMRNFRDFNDEFLEAWDLLK